MKSVLISKILLHYKLFNCALRTKWEEGIKIFEITRFDIIMIHDPFCVSPNCSVISQNCITIIIIIIYELIHMNPNSIFSRDKSLSLFIITWLDAYAVYELYA